MRTTQLVAHNGALQRNANRLSRPKGAVLHEIGRTRAGSKLSAGRRAGQPSIASRKTYCQNPVAFRRLGCRLMLVNLGVAN